MRIKVLAWSLAAALVIVARAQAVDDVTVLDKVEASDKLVAPDNHEATDAGPEQAACSEELDTRIMPPGWCTSWLGSTCNSHIYAGTEFTFLNVHSQTGGRTTASFSDTTAPDVATISFRENNGVDDWAYAPRLWLGAQITDKWSVQGRYWRLSDTDSHFRDLTPGTSPTGTNFAMINETDHTEAFTIDVEGVRTWQWNGWKADAFVGGRHAEFSADSDFLAFGEFTTGNFVNLTLQNGSGFEGSGVTYGGALRHRIGKSHLYAFGTVRGSALDGHSDSFARSDGAIASSPSAPMVGAATIARNDAEARLYIFELQGGLEFEWALRDLPANFFFRTAYEFQKWDIDGLPTGGAGFNGTVGQLTTHSFASAGLGGMTLQGVSVGTGLTWQLQIGTDASSLRAKAT